MTSTRDSAELVNNLKDSAFDFSVYSSVASAKADTKLKVGDTVQTTGYYAENDGGGATYIVVAGGTGTDDGCYYHGMDNGNQLEMIVVNNVVSVKQAGAVGDGVVDDKSPIGAAGAKGDNTIFFPIGTYLLSSDVTINQATRVEQDQRCRFSGVGRIKGNEPASYGSVSQIVSGSEPSTENGGSKWETYTDGGKAYLGTYLSLQRGGVPTLSTETDVLRVHGVTSQESNYDTGLRAGLVGIHARIAPSGGNLNSRLFGVNPYMELPPGTEGLVNGCEVNIINYASEVKVMNARDAKYAFNATCEIKGHTGTGYPATGAYKIATGGANEQFWTGLWAGVTSIVPDSAAQFIEFDKTFGINYTGQMGLGVEYSHADFSFTINGDGDYVSPLAISNPEQYGDVVRTDLGQKDSKILLNSGLDKSAQVTYAGQLTGSIYSMGRDDTDGDFKLVSGTNIRTGVELITVDTAGTTKILGQLAIGVGAVDPSADGAAVVLKNVTAAPSATVAGQGVIYVENGALKFRGGSGTVTTIAPA